MVTSCRHKLEDLVARLNECIVAVSSGWIINFVLSPAGHSQAWNFCVCMFVKQSVISDVMRGSTCSSTGRPCKFMCCLCIDTRSMTVRIS